MRPGLPAWRNLASHNENYGYRFQNMTSHGRVKRLPDRQLRPNLRYIMHFPRLQNGLINCFNVSRLLNSLRPIFYHSISPNRSSF